MPQGPGKHLRAWAIANDTILPIMLRMEHNWRLKPFSMAEAEIAEVRETWSSPRFAPLRQYLEDNKKRESVLKTWDEVRRACAFCSRAMSGVLTPPCL